MRAPLVYETIRCHRSALTQTPSPRDCTATFDDPRVLRTRPDPDPFSPRELHGSRCSQRCSQHCSHGCPSAREDHPPPAAVRRAQASIDHHPHYHHHHHHHHHVGCVLSYWTARASAAPGARREATTRTNGSKGASSPLNRHPRPGLHLSCFRLCKEPPAPRPAGFEEHPLAPHLADALASPHDCRLRHMRMGATIVWVAVGPSATRPELRCPMVDCSFSHRHACAGP